MKFTIGCFLLMLSLPAFSGEVTFLNAPGSENSKLPFSKATQVGNILFLSGELGTDPKTNQLVKGGVEAESKQVMLNIANTLKIFGSDLSKVAKCTVFLADINEWSKFNKVYVTFFKAKFPARSAVAGSGLALSARVEVECIAVV
jgi:2-iminobutanoate/2-iminopropanoate deaminase